MLHDNCYLILVLQITFSENKAHNSLRLLLGGGENNWLVLSVFENVAKVSRLCYFLSFLVDNVFVVLTTKK